MIPPLFPDLNRRAHQPELMDDPASDPILLEKTLAQFWFVNRVFARVRFLLKTSVIAAMQQEPDREHHLIDLGAGACETAAWLLAYCNQRGLRLRVTACDHDPRAVAYARRRFGQLPGLTILERDINNLDDLGQVDFIFGNHFLHHLADDAIVDLLRRLARLQPTGILLNDLERSRRAYLIFYLTGPFLVPGSFAWRDGLLSIRRAFRHGELAALTQRADLTGRPARIRRLFPNRIVWEWGFENLRREKSVFKLAALHSR